MSHFPIADTYAAYKRHERRFFVWLQQTASRAGHKASCSTSRLQNIKEFAATIIGAGVDLPYSVQDDLLAVISQRKEATLWYKIRNTADPGHAHYLAGLQGILKDFNDLGLLRDKNRGGIVSTEPSNMSDVDFDNRFDNLSLHGGSDSSRRSGEENAPGIEDTGGKAKSSKKKAKAKAKAKRGRVIVGERTTTGIEWLDDIRATSATSDVLETSTDYDESEKFMRVYCFFKDTKAMKDFICERWCDYQKGLLTLINVSLVTNTAFELLRQSEKELLSTLPENERTYKDIAAILYPDLERLIPTFEKYHHRDLNALYDYKDSDKEGKHDIDVLKVMDSICYTAWLRLSSWQKFPMDLSNLQNLRACQRDLNYGARTLEEKRLLDDRILDQLIVEVSQIKPLRTQSQLQRCGGDEFTMGIYEFLTTKKIPLWLVFAAQVMCEIRGILEKKVAFCHEQLYRAANRIKLNLDHCFEYRYSNDILPLKPETSELYSDLLMFVFHDYLGMTFETLVFPPTDPTSLKEQIRPKNDDDLKFYYLRLNPIMCGLTAFRYTLIYHELGLLNANATPCISSVVHVYNAVYQESKKESKEYPEIKSIESLLLLQTTKRIFSYIDRPSTCNGYAANYYRKLDLWKYEDSDIKPVQKLSSYFHKKFCNIKDCKHVRSTTIKEFLAATADDNTDVLLSSVYQLYPPGLLGSNCNDKSDPHLDELNREMETASLARIKRTRRLTNIELLQIMTRRVEKDSYFMHFNYLHLHVLCREIVTEIEDEFEQDMSREISGVPRCKSNLQNVPTSYIVIYFLFDRLSRSEEKRKDTIERLRKILATHAPRIDKTMISRSIPFLEKISQKKI